MPSFHVFLSLSSLRLGVFARENPVHFQPNYFVTGFASPCTASNSLSRPEF
jgi:hypothetical protein